MDFSILRIALDLTYGLALNALLVCAAVSLSRRGAKRGNDDDRTATIGAIESVLSLGLAFAALLVLIVTVAGSCGVLDNRPAVLALTAVAAWICGLLPSRRTKNWRSTATRALDSGRGLSHLLLRGRAGFVALGLLLIPWLAIFCDQAFVPPVAWDALTYHLVQPVHWIQTGTLSTLPQPFGEPGIPYFPLVVEILYCWGYLSTGSDAWTVFAQVPAALAGALAIAGTVVQLGARPRAGAIAGILWISLPLVIRQTVEPMVDIWIGAFFLAALFFVIRWREAGETGRIWFASAAAGLMVGTKYTGAVYLLPLFLLVAVAIPFRLRSGTKPGEIVRAVGAGTVVALLLGGYTYARNLWAGGNPFLPLEVAIGETVLFPGLVSPDRYFAMELFDDAHSRLTMVRFLFSPRAILDFGPGFAALAFVPFLAIGIAAARRSGARALPAALAVVALLLLAAHLFLIPYKSNRYLFPFAGTAIALALLIVPARMQNLLLFFPAVSLPLTLFYWGKEMAWGGVTGHHVFYFALIAACAPIAFLLMKRGRRSGTTRRRLITTAVLLLACAGAQTFYESQRYPQWLRFWSTRFEWESGGKAREDLAATAAAWSALADLTRDEPATIAHTGNNLPYPLTGTRLRNRILFVPRNENREGVVFDWNVRPHDILAGESKQAWLPNVFDLEVDYLCVFRMDERFDPELGFPVEDAWAREHPAWFVPVHTSHWARIYRVDAVVVPAADE